jgi:hypothetical protein
LFRFSFPRATLLLGVGLISSMSGRGFAYAEAPQDGDVHHDGDHPVYQQHAFDWKHRDDRRDGRDSRRNFPMMMSPQISAGWFQRPYPYHLDYYKMRYGGSYAPYFGNLYGTPQVVNYPPYYGPYYGGYGAQYSNDYEQGYGGVPVGYPPGPHVVMPGTEIEEASPVEKQAGESAAKSKGEALPAPKP